MIRPIDIRLNAAHPELPLAEAVTFTGSPSTVLIRGVPPNCGRWAITAVSVAATYPDGSTTTRAAVQSANGVWVATLPATATSGRTANGLRVLADGIDENGEAVTGYILGVADFAVASLGVTPAPEPGETSWQMLYFDAVPSTLRKGDVTKVDGVLKLYNGTVWEPFAAPVTFDDAVTRTSANGVKSSGIWSAIWGALSALPTGFTSLYDWCVSQLAGKAAKADATLTERGFSAWTIVVSPPPGMEFGAVGQPYYENSGWHIEVRYRATGEEEWVYDTYDQSGGDDGEDSLHVVCGTLFDCTRTVLGYILGSQDDKPLASEAEAEALRTGKMSASATGADILVGGTGGAASSDMATAIDDLFRLKADLDSPTFTGTPVAPTPQAGDNSVLIATTAFVQGAVPYALVTKTITNGAVSLDDHASNAVTISATLSPNTLTINFPTAPTGKLRDFAMRLNIAAGVTAPEIAWPQGVTLENNGGEVPEIADGGTGGSSTILYFSESENNGTTAKFTVKGETLTAIAQA